MSAGIDVVDGIVSAINVRVDASRSKGARVVGCDKSQQRWRVGAITVSQVECGRERIDPLTIECGKLRG